VKPRKLPLVAVPFVLALQAVALAGALAGMAAMSAFAWVLDETSPKDK
jgi:hypothetical protein